jgi:hypothetical protein
LWEPARRPAGVEKQRQSERGKERKKFPASQWRSRSY